MAQTPGLDRHGHRGTTGAEADITEEDIIEEGNTGQGLLETEARDGLGSCGWLAYDMKVDIPEHVFMFI
jgi:hypothetical protein